MEVEESRGQRINCENGCCSHVIEALSHDTRFLISSGFRIQQVINVLIPANRFHFARFFIIEVWVYVEGVRYCEGVSRNSLTRLSVDRDGLARGSLEIIHSRRVRIDFLSAKVKGKSG